MKAKLGTSVYLGSWFSEKTEHVQDQQDSAQVAQARLYG